jgi:hypothetical protein
MKFKQYIDDFRNLNIGIVDKETGNKELVRKIQEEFKLESDVVNHIDELNKLLRKKSKFDFVLGDSVQSALLERKFRIKKRSMDNLKLKFLELSDKLAKTKTEVESKISLQSDGSTKDTGIN